MSSFLAGKMFYFFTSIDNNTLIIDNGASDHITPNLSLLHDVRVIQDFYYNTMQNGRKAYIKHIGFLSLNSRLT